MPLCPSPVPPIAALVSLTLPRHCPFPPLAWVPHGGRDWVWVCLSPCCVEGTQHRLRQEGQPIRSCRQTTGAMTHTWGSGASGMQNWKAEPFESEKRCPGCRSQLLGATGPVGFQVCGLGKPHPLSHSVSSSGRWGCARSLRRHPAAHVRSAVILAAAMLPESTPNTEASHPSSESQLPHLATLPLRAHGRATAWMGKEEASKGVHLQQPPSKTDGAGTGQLH